MEEIEKKIDELLVLTQENNQYLKKMHRAQVWSGLLRGMYWAIIIGGSIGLWYYFQPILDQYVSTYTSLLGKVNSLNSGITSEDIGNIKSLIDTQLGN